MDSLNQERFERHLDNAHTMLKDLANRLTSTSQDAEDLYQTTVLKAFDKFDKFKEGTRFNSWVYIIMRNTWYDLVDKRKRSKEMLSEDINEHASEARKGPVDAAELVMQELIHPTLVEAVTSLPEPFKTTVYLVDVRGFSYAQAAEVMNTTLGAVTGRLNRGRKQMREFVSNTNLLEEISL